MFKLVIQVYWGGWVVADDHTLVALVRRPCSASPTLAETHPGKINTSKEKCNFKLPYFPWLIIAFIHIEKIVCIFHIYSQYIYIIH